MPSRERDDLFDARDALIDSAVYLDNIQCETMHALVDAAALDTLRRVYRPFADDAVLQIEGRSE